MIGRHARKGGGFREGVRSAQQCDVLVAREFPHELVVADAGRIPVLNPKCWSLGWRAEPGFHTFEKSGHGA